MNKSARKRNPATEPIHPHMNPEFPIKNFVDPETGRQFSTIAIPIPAGGYAAVIQQDESIQATGRTRAEAEKKVCRAFSRIPNPNDDWKKVKLRAGPKVTAADLRTARRAIKEGGLPLKEFRKRYGL